VRYPVENGRVVNPFNPLERPTFLPGDKIRDKRDHSKTTWRIVRRIAHLDSELMTFRKVGDDSNEVNCQSAEIVPWLEMVAMSATKEKHD
jgi:hypothetical protein